MEYQLTFLVLILTRVSSSRALDGHECFIDHNYVEKPVINPFMERLELFSKVCLSKALKMTWPFDNICRFFIFLAC